MPVQSSTAGTYEFRTPSRAYFPCNKSANGGKVSRIASAQSSLEGKLQLFFLLPYSPELNPDEQESERQLHAELDLT